MVTGVIGIQKCWGTIQTLLNNSLLSFSTSICLIAARCILPKAPQGLHLPWQTMPTIAPILVRPDAGNASAIITPLYDPTGVVPSADAVDRHRVGLEKAIPSKFDRPPSGIAEMPFFQIRTTGRSAPQKNHSTTSQAPMLLCGNANVPVFYPSCISIYQTTSNTPANTCDQFVRYGIRMLRHFLNRQVIAP